MDSLVSWFQKHLGSKEKYFIETDSLDLDELSAFMRVDSNGERNGKNNYPPSSSQNLDAFEERIVSFFNKRLSKINERANSEISKLNTTIAYPSINDLKKKLEAISMSIKESVSHSQKIKLKLIKNEKEHQENSEADYETFKKRFSLSRLPEYPESKFFVYSLVTAFWLIETILNGFFFAQGSDLGLLGGWFEASAVSFINIFISFFVGSSVVRYLNHPSTKLKIVTSLFLVSFVVFSFIFNLFVGHYRDMIGTDAINVAQTILPRVMDTPFAINDIFSWLLVIGGMFFALLALIDGYKSDDPFPRYGSYHRKLIEDRETYNLELEETAEEIESARNTSIQELERLQKTVKSEMTSVNHIRSLKENAKTRHTQLIKATVGQANSILKRYRQYNIVNREDSVPIHFDKQWKPHIAFEIYDPHPIDPAEIEALWNTAPDLINSAISEIRNAYNGYIESIHQIEPLFNTSTGHG